MFFTPLMSLALFGVAADPAAPVFGGETILLNNQREPIIEVVTTTDGRFLFVLDRQRRLLIRDLMGQWQTPDTTLANGSARFSRELMAGNWRTHSILGPKWLAMSRDGRYFFCGGDHPYGESIGSRSDLRYPEQIRVDDAGFALWASNLHRTDPFMVTIGFPEGHRFPITGAALSDNGKVLVTATGRGRGRGEVKVWDLPSCRERQPALQYRASTFFSATGDDDLIGLPVSVREAPGVERLALSPDGSTLATVYESTRSGELGHGTVPLWDTNRGTPTSLVVIPDQRVRSLTFTPDGKMVVLGVGEKGPGDVWLWDLVTSKAVGILRGHAQPIPALAVSQDGRFLASGGEDGVVKLWDIAGRREVQSRATAERPEPVRSLAFTPDGSTLVVAGGGERGWVRLWEVK